VDFALLSELSYYEPDISATTSDSATRPTLQQAVDALFPDLDFVVRPYTLHSNSVISNSLRTNSTSTNNSCSSGSGSGTSKSDMNESNNSYSNRNSENATIKNNHSSAQKAKQMSMESSELHRAEGPVYIELYSEILDLTVVAVRGTDIGRLHDFLEDMKLYSEPVLFTLLSTIFPTIRLWTSDTTSRIIEWLYHFNTFVGLQSEALYYQPLVARIQAIISQEDASKECDHNNGSKVCPIYDKKKNIVITGHSLGIFAFILFKTYFRIQ
jgi:hypothetical protein